jgi:penicillin G amidase
MKWFKRSAAALLVVVLGLVAALWIYAQRTLPVTQGELQLPGAAAELRIERDVHGIPTVHASSLRDAAYGLGVAHAQDRLWQMETQRRIGAGRLSEVFGAGALPTDRFLRHLGVRRAAQAQWAQLSASSRALLQAYADGVNAVLQTQLRARPPEFLVLGVQPEPWDPIDSLAWTIMMSWDLGGNWNTELLRLRLALVMPVERINELLPSYPGDAPRVTGSEGGLSDYAAFFRSLGLGGPAAPKKAAGPAAASGSGLATAWAALPDIAPPSGVEGVGSNNWVLAGNHSSTGSPLLANDPHLKLSAPSLWYLARIVVPPVPGQDDAAARGLRVAGATLPGLPLVVLGQNADIAWGFTNTGPDVQDLYLEQVDPADPARYRTPDGWAAFDSVTDQIRVKGQPAVPVTLRHTRHGPVISDAGIAPDLLDGAAGAAPPALVLALRWTALDPDTDPVATGLAFMQARSVDEFVAATRSWVAPMQSMVVADRAGRIGMVAPGRVPLRRADNELQGQVPAPGWEARFDWDGWVPVDETPREFDPPRGWIATANQKIVPADYVHYITSEWAVPYRKQRIDQLLAARPQHSLDDLATLQADQRSLAVPLLLPYLKRAQSSHPLAAAAQQVLAGFDGEVAAGSAAPLIYWAWQRQLAQGVFADDAGEALWNRSLSTRTFIDSLQAVLARDDARWCDDQGTPAAETCAQQSGAALTRALDELQAAWGDDVAGWRWGQAHQARSEHRPFSRVPALARLFELRAPVGGDTFTVNVSRVGLRPDATTGELYLDEHGPSLRALYDVADPGRSRVMHSTGQSGIVFSPLYRSFVQPWQKVAYVSLWPGDGAQADVLVVKPGP